MSANRANINWHLLHQIGGQVEVPTRGQAGFAPGTAVLKTTGEIGLGLYINYGDATSCDFRGTNGQSPILDGGAEQLLYELSTTQNYDLGAIERRPDGSEFRYSLSTGASVLNPNMGCNFTDTGYISYTSFVVAAAQGVKEITIPAATHAALTKDALRGGYVVIFDGSGVNDVTCEIAGNDAAEANALFKVRLTAKLPVTITTADACEVYKNPWGQMADSNTPALAFAGVPVLQVSAAANYFWLQTKGPKFVNPQTGVGNDNGGVVANWRHDGSLEKAETALAVTVDGNDSIQPAGVVIAGSAAGNGPLLYLGGL